MIPGLPARAENAGLRRIVRHAGQLTGTRLVTYGTRALYLLILARLLGPELYGLLAYGHAWYVAFLPLGLLGTGLVIVRLIAQRPEDQTALIGHSLALRMFSALISALLCVVIGYALQSEPKLQTLFSVFALALAGRALNLWCDDLFVAFEHPQYILLRESVMRPSELMLGVAVVLSGGGIVGVALVHALSLWVQFV